jgi:hypothetical protein
MKKNIMILFLLTTAFFSQSLFASPSMILGSIRCDMARYFFYSKAFGLENLLAGHIPLWNPHIFCGFPYISAAQSSLFYPLNVIYLLAGVARGMNLFIAAHIFLAGLGIVLLLNEFRVRPLAQLAGATAFMFSAPLVCRIYPGHLGLLGTSPWVAFVCLFAYRIYRYDTFRESIFLSLGLGLLLLSGTNQYCYYVFIALLLYSLFLFLELWKKGDGKKMTRFSLFIVTGIILGLALSSIQLIPGIEFSINSNRQHLPYSFSSSCSFPPENMVTFLCPFFFGNPNNGTYWGRWYHWEACSYFGIISLLLSLIAFLGLRKNENKNHVIAFGIFAALFIIASLGGYTPFFKILYSFFPGISMFRAHSRFLFIGIFFLSLLVGLGLENLLRGDSDMRKSIILRFLLPAIVVVAGFSLFFSLHGSENNYEPWKKLIYSSWKINEFLNQGAKPPFYLDNQKVIIATFDSALRQIFRLLIFLSFFGLFISFKDVRKTGYLIVILLVADMFSFGIGYLPMLDSRQLHMDPGTKSFISSDPSKFRIVNESSLKNCCMIEKIEDACGYESQYPKDYFNFVNYSQGDIELSSPILSEIRRMSEMTTLLNVKYQIADRDMVLSEQGGFQKVYQNEKSEILLIPGHPARAFFVRHVDVLRHEEILPELARADFVSRHKAFVEEPLPVTLEPGAKEEGLASIKIITYENNRIVLDTKNSTRGLLVFCDAYYPGWTARVNGRPQKIFRTDYLFRGIFLEAGDNHIEFSYLPASLNYGALISSCALILIVLLSGFLCPSIKRREPAPTPPP